MENKVRKYLLYCLITGMCWLPGKTIAGGYHHFGARALGMGGAYTAVANEESAVYWNPAGIGTLNQGVFQTIYGHRNESHKSGEDILRELVDEGLIDADDIATDAEASKRSKLLQRLAKQGTGVERTENLDFILAGPSAALSSITYKICFVDTAIPNSKTDSTFYDVADTPLAQLSGIDVIEWNLTVAYMKAANYYSIGTNIKYLETRTYFNEIPIRDLLSAKATDLFDETFESPSEKERKFTMDAGYIMFLANGRFAIVTKNIIEPKLHGPEDYTYKLQRMVRMGYAYTPNDSFTISIDVDLTKNKNRDIGYSSREIAAGFEKIFGVTNQFAVRFGFMKNISEADDNFIFTSGCGVKTKYLKFDFGYGRDTEGEEQTLQVSASLGF